MVFKPVGSLQRAALVIWWFSGSNLAPAAVSHSLSLSGSIFVTHTLSHSHSHSLSHTLSLSLTHTLSLSLSLSHTHSLSLSLSHTHTHTQGRRTRGGCGCFNTHTFRDERVQHPHFFCSFSAVSHKRLTAVAPRFLWPPCVWECARCSCLLSPPSQT